MAANEIPPHKPDVPPAGSELEDLDKVLLEMDPQFAKELDAMKKVESAADVQIETTVLAVDEFSTGEDNPVLEEPKTWKRRFRTFLQNRKANFVAWLRRVFVALVIFFSTVPKEFALYSWATLKRVAIAAKKVVGTYLQLPRYQKFGILIFAGLIGLTLFLVRANLRGGWLPSLYPPLQTGFAPYADASFDFDPKTDMIPFFKAFPQDPEIFLFQKIKVNLRAGNEHPNPMGAFEIYAQVDSHDTAIEVQTRQVELHDMIQRVIEGQNYNELVSELGKNRLKGLLKKEIDHALTQGWVTDIHFKTFILKP